MKDKLHSYTFYIEREQRLHDKEIAFQERAARYKQMQKEKEIARKEIEELKVHQENSLHNEIKSFRDRQL